VHGFRLRVRADLQNFVVIRFIVQCLCPFRVGVARFIGRSRRENQGAGWRRFGVSSGRHYPVTCAPKGVST
jgi:hypothetical protein